MIINGTSAGQTLTGTSSADVISGKGGNDIIYGYGGDDVIYAYSVGYTSFYIGNARIWGGDGNDKIYLQNSNVTNYAYGEQGDDQIWGLGANDVIDGGSGNDYIDGGGGADSLYGGTGNDVIKMGIGSSTAASIIDGGYDDDDLYLSYSGNLTAIGGQGNDDFFVGQPCYGGTKYDGGTETDRIVAIQNNFLIGIKSITGIEEITNTSLEFGTFTGVKISAYAGSAPLDFTQTALNGIEEIRGYSTDNNIIYLAGKNATDAVALGRDDLVNAGDGDDIVYGGYGSDTLNGQNGNDTLAGGAGNGDVLTGGAGADTFIFHFGDGADTITDLSLATTGEHISIGAFAGVDDFSDLAGLMSQVGADTVIDFGGGDTLTLTGITATDLTAAQFDFFV
ncbi:MAG: hypothetical protein J0I79_20070 [Mesorhizobium sp.]|uniref:calcium-binding protein n=1 Tax=Mesorhizobium sp. TaxID=1871066 RepID=UPI001AC60350|nr:calcium-binding protein [Mesorhizobium sp.]MBN9220248.1 hypothetical protein [Mesorhizobium sp.]